MYVRGKEKQRRWGGNKGREEGLARWPASVDDDFAAI